MREYLENWRRPGRPSYAGNCIIWNDWGNSTITELWEPTRPNGYVLRGHLVNSERAGGHYVLWQKAKPFTDGNNDHQKARLTTWLVDQRIQGDLTPEITPESLEYAIQKPDLQVHARAERLLKHIAGLSNSIGAEVNIRHDTPSPYAWSESTKWEEVVYLLNYLRDSGWLNVMGIKNKALEDVHLTQNVVTVAGFNQITKQSVATDFINTPATTSSTIPHSVFPINQFALNENLVFVLSPFGKPFDTIFTNHIKPTVENIHDLTCVRADDIYDNQPVIDDIWRLTNEAGIIIAEFTDRNANVFYETGLAHAIGKEVIPITQSMGDVPFDLRHRRCIVYEYTPEGIDELKSKLTNTITNILDRTSPTRSSS